jgi:hypothetical protein
MTFCRFCGKGIYRAMTAWGREWQAFKVPLGLNPGCCLARPGYLGYELHAPPPAEAEEPGTAAPAYRQSGSVPDPP